MGRKCQVQTNRANSHSKFTQTVTSKQWRSRKLSKTAAGTDANNVGSNARAHAKQTIRRQRFDEMDCTTVMCSPHSIVPWADRIEEHWWRVWRNSSCTSSSCRKGIWKSRTKIGRQMECGWVRATSRTSTLSEQTMELCMREVYDDSQRIDGQKRTSRQSSKDHKSRGR